jgi:hypothetical protein
MKYTAGAHASGPAGLRAPDRGAEAEEGGSAWTEGGPAITPRPALLHFNQNPYGCQIGSQPMAH